MTARVRTLFERRGVLRLLIARDLKLKYERSVLGYFWTILEPLLLAAIYWFVFQKIAKIGIDDYPLFIIAGLLPWLWASGSISSSTSALQGSGLVATADIPREIWVLRLIGAKAVEYLLGLPVLILFAVVFQVAPSRYLLLFPIAMLVQMVFLTGLALFLSAVNVIFNDVQRIMRVIIRILFYLSPVLYPGSRVPDSFAWLYNLNPFVGILETFRAAWFPDVFPGFHVLGISVAGAVVMLAFGWFTFSRLERVVLKEL